jgi:hypothetical protein
MISIHSAEENEFIRKLVKNQSSDTIEFWIGAKRKTFGLQKFGWINKSPFDYTNWDSGEPNNYGGNEHYVEMVVSSGVWNDNGNPEQEADWTKFSFVCETYTFMK